MKYFPFFLGEEENILIFYSSFNRVFSFTNWTFPQLFVLLHFIHKHRCPQLQNKTLGGLDKHIAHSSD